MPLLPHFIALAACLVIIARLLMFRRRNRRHRRSMALSAWAIANLIVMLAIYLMRYGVQQQALAWMVAILLTLFAWLICRADGNVAKLFRIELPERIRAWF